MFFLTERTSAYALVPYEVYIGLEAGAASIRNFEPSVVPGLLQTEDYARETFRNGPIELDPAGVERLVEVRLARQEILTRDYRPRLRAVIDEAVIRRVVGGTVVMRGQLRYLADPAQQGKTTIQIVPYRAGAHAGTTGPFVILDFEEPTDPAMVYVETLAGDIYLESVNNTEASNRASSNIGSTATSSAVRQAKGCTGRVAGRGSAATLTHT